MKFGDYLKNRKNQSETESKKNVSENSFGAYLQGREAEKVESLYHSYLKDVQDLSTANKARFFDDKGNYIEKYRVDSDEWYNSSARATNLLKSKAQKIRKYLDDYGGYHDDEYVSQLRTQLDSNDSYLDDLLKSAEDHKEYNSQWKDEDAYNNDMMDWLEEDYESTPEKVKARRDRFKSNTDRVAQIKEEIKALEVKRSEAFSDPNTSMDVVATYDDKIAALEDERDKLKVENRKYERHHKTDSYYDVTQSEDFAETSAKREFANPTEAELDKYDSDLYNAERWYADNAVYGATKDENGNVYDAKGNLKFSVTPASVEDKLGLFLSASKDDIARASNELTNNTDVNNTWASIISEGSANDWSQLDDDELGIYYSLLNTKGQKEAYKFLDDMTVELNRRANEEMEKEISGATLLEKLAYSAASTPVNIISGVPALIDNISHIVQGEEINPYSKANSLMNFASASRGAMAEEINEWTGNASLPYLGTTWGDVYQYLKSGGDSWAGAAIFGPSYPALMSSNAAASKMKEMYENGATTSQMVIGGGVAGAAEYLFEKLPLEGMLKILKDKDLKGGRAIASAWLKQSATEAFEEMGTETTNILADALVLGSQSDLAGYVDKYMANGDSKGLAIWKALAYDVAPEVINAGISGLISGGAIGGVASVAKYANYRAETTNHGRDILAKKGVPALKALADEVSGVTEGKLGKDIGKLSSKVSATPLEGKNKLSTAIKNRNNANAIGRLSNMVEDARISLNTADVVSALKEKGLSSKEAKKGAETIISRANGEDVELDNLKVAEVYDELVGEGESKLKEFITERNIHHGATRLGIDTKNRTVDGKSIEKEVSTEGRIAESGKTTIISTGEEITIDKSNPIAKTKTVDGVDKVFFNTDKGVVEASDITYANENEALIYESFTDLHPSVASAAIKAYDGTVPAQTYINGMREGILLYGKHNFQAVGKDISVNSSLAQLSSADQALALKLGKAVANIETSNADKALKSAVKSVAEKAKKDIAEGKNTARKGTVRYENGVKPSNHSQKRAVALAKHLASAIGIDIVFYDARTTTGKGKKANGYYENGTIYLDLQKSKSDSHTIAFTLSHELVHFVKEYSPAKFKVFADFLMEEYAKHGVSTSTLLANKMAELNLDPDEAYEEMIADACERMLLDSDVMLKLAKLKKIDLDLFEKIRLHILDILNKIRAEYKRMNYAPTSDEAKALLKMEDVIGKLHEKFEEMVVDATENFQTLDTESVKVSEDGTIMMQMKQYETTGRDTLLKYLRRQYGKDNANDLISTMDNLYNTMVDLKKDTALSVFGNWQEQEVELDENGHPIFTTSINNGDYVLNQDFSRVCKKRRQLNFVLNMLAEDPAFEASNLTKDDIVKINQAIKSHGFEIACALCFVDSKRYRQTEWADSFANTWNDILYSVVKDKSKLTPFNFATQNPNTNDDGIEIDTSKPVMYRKWSNGKEDVKNRRNHDSFDRMLEKTEDNKFVEGNSNVRAIVRILKENPNLRHTFRGADIIASDGFDMIQRLAPDIRSILDGWGGTSVPKPSSNDAIYDNSVLNIDGYNAKKAFAIGGVRMNSFSDFMAHMFFDYAQAFADLSAKKLPMHSYTKELDFARLFGLTRGKINMSAIAAIRENATDLSKVKGEANKEAVTKWEKSIAGLDISKLADKLGKAETDITYDDVVQNLDDCEYVWADESIDVQSATLLQSGIMYDNLTEGKAAYCYELIKEGKFDEAFKVAGEENVNREYAKHLGIITVGVSKAHILKLMRDPTIRMVIPYHKSGLNAQVAKALKILFYEDFTDVQNTMLKLKDGSTVGLSKDGAKIKDKNIRDFNFYDYFGKTIDGVFYDGKATASKYLEWCEKGDYNAETGEYGYYLTDGTFVTKAELDSKGLSVIPKFSEFAEEENYYKLIEDFDCYDTITGEHSSQEAVDFLREDALPADYKDVLLRALKAEQKVSDDFRDHLDNQGLRDEIMEIVGKNGYTPSKVKKQKKTVAKDNGAVYNVSNEKHSPIAWVLNNNLLTPAEIKSFNSTLAKIDKHDEKPWMRFNDGSFVIDVGSKLILTKGTMERPHIFDVLSYIGDDKQQFEIIKESIKDVINFRPNKQRSKSALETIFDTYVLRFSQELDRYYFRDFTAVQGYDFYGEGLLRQNVDRVDSQGLAEEGDTPSDTDIGTKSQKQITGYIDGTDADYLDAVNRGDMETAQKMVNLAAKKAGAKVKMYYHSTSSDFTSFDIDKTRFGNYGYGFYISSKGNKLSRGDKVMPVYVVSNKIATTQKKTITADRVKKVIDEVGLSKGFLGNDIEKWVSKRNDSRVLFELQNKIVQFKKTSAPTLLGIFQKRFGFDGLNIAGTTVIWNNNLLKSAEPVTYDEDGNVIPLSKRFDDNNKDIRFQKKKPSNRELLSNALESTIDTSSAEGKVLQEYKNNIGKIEELEAHLAEVKTEIYKLSFGKGARDNARLKELNEDKVKTANRINIYDKKLLRIEATKPLKDILVREKEKVRKAEKQKGEEALQRLKEKDAATLREVMERNQESRRKNVEGRQKTEMRNKIKGVVGDLNKMFKAGRKKANVKAGMRDTVAQALATAELLFSNDITNEDIVRNGVTVATSVESKKLNRYMDLLSKRETYLNKIDVMMGASLSANIDEERQMVEKIGKEIRVLDKELKDVFERERNRLNEVVISSAIQDLADAYKSIKDSEQSYISAAYNEYVYDRLLLLKEEVGGSSIRDMSLNQLREVYEAYKMVLHVVRTANTLFKDGKAVDDIADAVVSEIKSIAKPRNRTVPTELLNRAVWNELKPRTAFETVGSDTLLELYDNLRKGEDTFAMDVYEAFEFADGARKRHNYKKWDMKSRIDFKLESGKTFSVNLQQLMSIYAYSKREQAHKHMTNGGFVFDSKETFTKKKGGIIERLPTAETYRLSANDISKIINTLAEKYSDAKAYVDEMQKYLTDMGEKGNEVSRLVFGIDLFKEKVYFPLQSSRDYLRSNNDALDKKNATPSLINSGMTKETTPNAENPIVLSGFDNVWASHTNKMSLYHSFVPALEDFRKVYEYSSSAKGMDYVSVRAEITNVFGANATDYISKFIDDVNGGMPNNEMSNPIMSLFSTFKKTSVGMSLSTVIQQPTAIIRAWSILNPKYFAGIPHNNLSPAQWDEVKRYAPIAILKEIGGFDAGSGRGMVDYLAGDVNKTWLKKTSSTIDDASMWLAGKGDVLGWGMIWNAVKREVADTTNLTEGSEEFFEKCGERFTEVITETQVYDSTFSRSGYMRSKNELNKFATSFMAEPTTAINMLYRAVINAKRGKISKAQAIGTIASVVLSQFMASALVSLVYAARDDDEDESYLEKYFESLGGRIRDDINVLNMLPYLRDIQSLFDGWDVERPDMAIFADIKKAYDGLQSKTKSPYMKWRDFIAAISNAFGVPLGNLERDLRAIFYNVPKMLFDDATPTFENSLEAFGDGLADKDTSMKERAWNAHQKGNTSKVKRTVAEMVEAKVKSGKTEKEAKSGVRSSFTLTYKKAYLEALDDKDYKTMNDIRKFLFSTGLYGSLSELDKSLENWRKSK